MEFVGGQSLEQLLSRENRKLPLNLALSLARELAEALECAHLQGVVHRDLKPANILITEDKHAKIADFGVAKLNLANHTLAGRALGTPAYMSPEQLNGDPVDGRSDLFSLGVVLYTMVTGYRPFQGNSALTVSFKVVNREPIPATVLECQLPPGLDSVIDRAMAKDPAERYQSGKEMARDLEELAAGRQPVAKSVEPPAQSPTIETKLPVKKEERMKPSAEAKHTPESAQHRLVAHKLAKNVSRKVYIAMLACAAVLIFFGANRIFWHPSPAAAVIATQTSPPMPPVGEIAAPSITPPAKATETADEAPAAPPEAENSVSAPRKARESVEAAKPGSVIAKKPAKPRMISTQAAVKPASLISEPAASPIIPATLEIEIEHKFAEAQLTVWVDDQVSYTHALEGTDKKRLGLFHHVQGHEFHAMQIPPGSHRIKVQVTSGDQVPEKTANLTGDFTSGVEKKLHINFDKRGEMNLSLD
jgi:serine/threonine-protein kinase